MGCLFCCCDQKIHPSPKEKLSFNAAVEQIRQSAHSIIASPPSAKMTHGDITSWVKPQTSIGYNYHADRSYDDTDSEENNQYKQTCCDKIPIIHPFGPFRLIWDSVIIILLLYTAIEVPCK